MRHNRDQQLEKGRVARVSRLMALAIKFQRLVEEGAVRKYAEVATLGHVTRSRQILILANLAPSIQEALLFLPRTVRGPDCATETRMRHIAGTIDWETQRKLFRSSRSPADAVPLPSRSGCSAGQPLSTYSR